MVCGHKLKINDQFMVVCANAIIEEYKNAFPVLLNNKTQIIEIISKEQKTFEMTLEKGFKIFENEIAKHSIIDSEVVFKLVDTYGFPYEIIKELCLQQNIKFDENAYFATLNKHKEISRTNVSVGFDKQMTDLINFNLESEFLYNELEYDAKIIALYNEDFHSVEQASNKC
jgi:alanyl-tRNA synthetase